MIVEMRLENFKSIRSETRIPLAPITLLYGHNSAGKSSIIQALLLLNQSSGDDLKLQPNGNAVNLGSYNQLIHAHDAANDLRLGVTIREDETDTGIDLHYTWNAAQGQSELIAATINGKAQPSRVVAEQLRRGLGDLSYFPPYRKPWGPDDVCSLDQKTLADASRNLERLGWPYTLDRSDGGALILHDTRNGLTFGIHEVGHGLSQILPILIELAQDSRSVIIEQPEIHLHPGFQTEFADQLIQAVKGGGDQVIIESHSEALILRLQRRIRQHLLSPDDLRVIHVDQNPNGNAVIRELRLDSRGTFVDEWPRGFFTEQFNEIFGDFA